MIITVNKNNNGDGVPDRKVAPARESLIRLASALFLGYIYIFWLSGLRCKLEIGAVFKVSCRFAENVIVGNFAIFALKFGAFL
jgi:hypothetical protein